MVKVHIEQGWLEGEKRPLVTKDGDYYSFKGIPYAEPPVGTLRFKTPRPPIPWDGIRKATEHGPVCPQVHMFTQQYIPGDEDCLYLNVYTKDINPKSPQPVMVFIHGGGYKCGSGNDDQHGPDFLVNHGVVLVTINYRLDALGFLCLDSKDVPGNAGLKDQVAALQWVKKNIRNFGGDPKNVTLFGQSAGGASTGLHLLSPLSKGLFQKAICMSGVPLCDWSVPCQPQKRGFALGKMLGFETTDEAKLLKFLQKVPVEKLVNTAPFIASWEEEMSNSGHMHFTPVVEKEFGQEHFMTKEPLEILRKGDVNDVDVIIGYTNEEALMITHGLEAIIKQFKYPNTLVPRKIFMNTTPSKVLEVADEIRLFYFSSKPIDKSCVREAVSLISESFFTYDIRKFLRLYSKASRCKKYMYLFSCVSERNVLGNMGAQYGIVGASHLDDLMYLFDAKEHNLPIDKDSKSYKMVELTCNLFTNFAKYGNPTPDSTLGTEWLEYDEIEEHYLNIDERLTYGRFPNLHSMDFWNSIYKQAGIEY